jgi:hypothetical protein
VYYVLECPGLNTVRIESRVWARDREHTWTHHRCATATTTDDTSLNIDPVVGGRTTTALQRLWQKVPDQTYPSPSLKAGSNQTFTFPSPPHPSPHTHSTPTMRDCVVCMEPFTERDNQFLPRYGLTIDLNGTEARLLAQGVGRLLVTYNLSIFCFVFLPLGVAV